MLQQIAIKNPGCPFCRYYLPPQEWDEKATAGVCLKGAKRIIQKQAEPNSKKRWKWVDCSYAEERNKRRLCQDFRVPSFLWKLISQLWLIVRGAGIQEPPSYKKEMWWNR